MPVTLPSALPKIAFSKNPVWLKIYSDDFRPAAPVTAVNRIDVNGAVAPGLTFSLSWLNNLVEFTTSVTPDSSGVQIPSGDGGSAYAATLRDYLDGNFFINRDFTVTLTASGGHPRVILTAKQPGAAFNLLAGTTGNLSTGNITLGVTGAAKPNFSHYIEIWVQNVAHTGYDLVFDAVEPLDEPQTGYTTLDISGSLHSALSLDPPDLSSSPWQPCKGSSRNYFVKYAQYYGDKPSIQRIYTSPVGRVVYGGYSNVALGQISDISTYLAKYLLPVDSMFNLQRWLETWPIDKLTVKTNQPQCFYFVNNRSVTETLKIKVVLSYSDATAQTVYIPGGSLASFEKVAIGCGFEQLGLHAYTTSLKTVTSYSVSLLLASNNETRSVVKTFTVNRTYEAYSRDFMYADSAGNFKTLHTFGRNQVSSEVDFDQVEYQPDPAKLPQAGNYVNANIKAVITDKVNTGYIKGHGAFDAVSELLLSKEIYRVFAETLVPIVVLSKKMDLSAPGKSLNSFELEYRLAYDEQLYTADSYALSVPNFSQSQQSINDI